MFFGFQRSGDEDLLHLLEIPTGELILESRIGTGFTAEVYKGIWTRRGDTVRRITEGNHLGMGGGLQRFAVFDLGIKF